MCSVHCTDYATYTVLYHVFFNCFKTIYLFGLIVLKLFMYLVALGLSCGTQVYLRWGMKDLYTQHVNS